jgi:hypothetical protein
MEYQEIFENATGYNLNECSKCAGGEVCKSTDICHYWMEYSKWLESNMKTLEDKITYTEDMITIYGQLDGGHHKMWVMDQIMRGIKKDSYEQFVKDYEHMDDDGTMSDEKLYEWDTGIAP